MFECTITLPMILSPSTDKVLSWRLLIIPLTLAVIYGMLSYISLIDQTFFFESMSMPTPNHYFLIWSWGGKNTAILVGLVLAILSRRKNPLIMMLIVLVVMQIGDTHAGLRTGVDVFVTYIAFGLVVLEFILLVVFSK